MTRPLTPREMYEMRLLRRIDRAPEIRGKLGELAKRPDVDFSPDDLRDLGNWITLAIEIARATGRIMDRIEHGADLVDIATDLARCVAEDR